MGLIDDSDKILGLSELRRLAMDDLTIGVLGGMGTYATIHLFQQYAEVFPAIKEWDRPRIIIDNRCTMPSRVRAFLYGENVELLVDEMIESMQNLVRAGCNRIILSCNTAHLFLPEIYERDPSLEKRVVNIVQSCVECLAQDNIKSVYLLATEGTIDSGVYQKLLKKSNISCSAPTSDEYHILRGLIEAVKQNEYSDEVRDMFLELVSRSKSCVLGCTELPILYEKYSGEVSGISIFDPLLITLNRIHDEYIRGRMI